LVCRLAGQHTLADAGASIPLPWAGNPSPLVGEYARPTANPNRADLENPWTLSFRLKRTADLHTRGVILSSGLVEICANYTKDIEIKEKDANGKTVKTKSRKTGIGILRAAGNPGKDPHDSVYALYGLDGVAANPLPLNQWVSLTIVGLERQTLFYVNGKLAGTVQKQMVCPLQRLGSTTGNSFIGVIDDLRVWNMARTAQQIERSAARSAP
jgi:hypothetical protein